MPRKEISTSFSTCRLLRPDRSARGWCMKPHAPTKLDLKLDERFEDMQKIEGQTGLDPSAAWSGKSPVSHVLSTCRNLAETKRPTGRDPLEDRSKNRQCALFRQPITQPQHKTGLKREQSLLFYRPVKTLLSTSRNL